MSALELPAYLRGMSKAALANVAETGIDVRADLGALVSGETDAAALLASCLRGADADRRRGWEDYVAALEAVASVVGAVATGSAREAAYVDAIAAHEAIEGAS